MILIYAEKLTPRLEYISKLIFKEILKVGVSITTSILEFRKSELPKINYSNQKFDDELYLKPHGILFEKTISYPDLQTVWYLGEKYFLNTSENSFLPFDPLAASFFLVTRMEEYLETEKDKYGCYPVGKSLLSKYGLLRKPVVNIWAQIIAGKISEQYPSLEFPKPTFNFLSTIDIDNAWAYAHKGFIRSLGALVKDFVTGNWENNKKRIHTLLNLHPDPYNNYDYINSIFKNNEDNIRFFFLLGDYKKHDKNVSFKNRYLRELIKNLSQSYDVGIHPSFYSGEKRGIKKLAIEKARLENIIDKKVVKSRQHFLRLFFPLTYRSLIEVGIKEDFSMGYSAQTGFRAGICSPYNFYDLERDIETNLRIYPFQVMDVTLRDYLNLSVEEAKIEIGRLIDEVRKIGGTFISIWHNESLTNNGQWEGYREVFEFMNETGFRLANGKNRAD